MLQLLCSANVQNNEHAQVNKKWNQAKDLAGNSLQEGPEINNPDEADL